MASQARPLSGHAHAEALNQSMPGMSVPINKTRHDHIIFSVDDLGGFVSRSELLTRTHGLDPIAGYGNRSILDDPSIRVHGDHGPADNENVDRLRFLGDCGIPKQFPPPTDNFSKGPFLRLAGPEAG